ncbi:hypothetical protein D3C85_1892530 [compost metagenome]
MLIVLHTLMEKLDHLERQLGIKIALEILDDSIEPFGRDIVPFAHSSSLRSR